MTVTPIILSLAIALAVVTAMTGVALVVRAGGTRRTRQRLQEMSMRPDPEGGTTPAILRNDKLTAIPALDDLLWHLEPVRRLHRLLAQGDLPMTMGKFLLLMIVLAVVGAVSAAKISHWAPSALIGGAAGFMGPVLFAVQKKRRRIAAFEKNFADSLDILTAALRAGLAFSAAVQVVAEESPDPVAKEFGIVFEENRLGLDMREALRNLAGRVDCAELRMFVTAVILQRETGGNLAEILDGTAYIIRDRFRILGEVRALTAQQRFSGIILSLLPLAMCGIILVTAPDYMKVLLTDPWGKYLIIGALFMQLVGYLAIRKIVAIKV